MRRTAEIGLATRKQRRSEKERVKGLNIWIALIKTSYRTDGRLRAGHGKLQTSNSAIKRIDPRFTPRDWEEFAVKTRELPMIPQKECLEANLADLRAVRETTAEEDAKAEAERSKRQADAAIEDGRGSGFLRKRKPSGGRGEWNA